MKYNKKIRLSRLPAPEEASGSADISRCGFVGLPDVQRAPLPGEQDASNVSSDGRASASGRLQSIAGKGSPDGPDLRKGITAGH